MRYTFNKQERLHSKKAIDLLFANGKSTVVFPVKMIWAENNFLTESPAQAMFIVPKRLFKRANKRNTLKRRMREAYRLLKPELYEKIGSERKILIAFIYIGNESFEFERINASLKKLLQSIN